MTVKYPIWINKIEGAAQTPEEMNGLVEVLQNHSENLSLHHTRILAAASGIYTDALTPSSEVPTEVGDKVFLATIPGTYTNFGNVVLPENNFGFIFKNGNSFSLQSMEMPMQDLSTVVSKSSLKSSEIIDYSTYIINGFTYNGSGVKIESLNSKIIEDLPIKVTESHITIKNIIPDSLKKVFFKNNEGVIVGTVLGLDVVPKVLTLPNGASKLCLCFSRLNQTELPIIEYGDNSSANIYEIENKKLTAQKLSSDNEVPNPATGKNAVNKEYFDLNAVREENFEYDYIYTNNRLNRNYIVFDKYINGSGEVLTGVSNHIIQNHPVSEYAGMYVTLAGYMPESLKKLVFRGANGEIVGSVISLTRQPLEVRVPDLAFTFDMTIKRSTEANVSVYDELRMNIGQESLPFEPYKYELITTILGKKIYAEKAKGAESGGSGGASYDQSLNKADDVEFNSIKTNQLIYSAIQFNLPQGNGTPPAEVQIGDAWIDTTSNVIKVKMS